MDVLYRLLLLPVLNQILCNIIPNVWEELSRGFSKLGTMMQ
jgi:hypothetical protein